MVDSTLILNADYTPLSLIPISTLDWKDAIKIMYLGNATVIEYYDDWFVHSPSQAYKVPAIMASGVFIKKKHYVRFSRTNLLLRDNFTCQYCNEKLDLHDLTIDHVVPRVRGGITNWTNTVSSCYTCNTVKGYKSHMKPKTKPIKPDYHQLLHNAKKQKITIPSEKWLPYLDWDNSLVKIIDPKTRFDF